MRIVDVFVSVLFALFAYFQLNDPDPAYWVIAYGGTSVLALSAALGYYSLYWTVLNSGAVAVGMIMALNGFIAYFLSGDPGSLTGPMLADKPWVEPAREFIGLASALGALVWYQRRAMAKRRVKDW